MGWQERVRQLQQETYALYLAAKNPRVPWYARLWLVVVVGYALSPIDLIPDFIPLIGYLDDLLLIPLGVLLAIKLIPPAVLAECRAQAQETLVEDTAVARAATAVIAAIWLLAVALVIYTIARVTG